MKRMFSLDIRRTQITHLYSPRTPAEAIAEARNAEADGADGIALEMNRLPPEFRTEDVFRSIVNSVSLPFMFILYRNDQYKWDDEKRMAILLDAARAGVGMIDMMGDLYDPSSDERTRNPEAIKRQMQTIEQIHELGSQVVISSHPYRPMSSDEVCNQLNDFAQRGADVVKIVTKVDTDEQFAESIRTTLRLHREMKKPFIHLAGGKFSRIQRMTGISLGVAITFAVHEYHDYAGYDQPMIRSFKEIEKNMHWNICNYPE